MLAPVQPARFKRRHQRYRARRHDRPSAQAGRGCRRSLGRSADPKRGREGGGVMAAFLLEVGVEEIPDWMIEPALAELSTRFEKLLVEERLGGRVEWVDATPRRLVLKASGLAAAQADSKELVIGPPKSAGAGAAQGFAKKMGTTVDQLCAVTTDKGEYFSFEKQTKGRGAVEILSSALAGIITTLYFPKTMYWTGKGGVKFIRPIRWIVALLDDAIVPFEIAGVRSGAATHGHRVLGA